MINYCRFKHFPFRVYFCTLLVLPLCTSLPSWNAKQGEKETRGKGVKATVCQQAETSLFWSRPLNQHQLKVKFHTDVSSFYILQLSPIYITFQSSLDGHQQYCQCSLSFLFRIHFKNWDVSQNDVQKLISRTLERNEGIRIAFTLSVFCQNLWATLMKKYWKVYWTLRRICQ